jgi:cysteinyl-tRNA synthetase
MLHIYNTATKQKEPFKPHNPELVTMYNCGLTVYDRPHIGNLRAYTMADVARRSLNFLGYKVKQVQNFTDVGHLTFTDEQKLKLDKNIEITDSETGIDRMEKAAKKTGKTVWEVAQYYIDEAMIDFADMNFIEPEVRPRATNPDEMAEQIALIKILLKKGYAYITTSAIYFDTSKSENYGRLTGQKLDEKIIGAREDVERDPTKKNPFDFRLWQLDQKDHAMQWDFEYEGQRLRGFPGWHVECSAMIHRHLGEPIDIHTGGVDHISVHHTNEIAQSEAAYGAPFVNYWMHNEFISVDGRKMGKSLGNAYNLSEIKEKRFDAMDLRYFYLTANFRTSQNFTWEALEGAKSARKRLLSIVVSLQSAIDNHTLTTNPSRAEPRDLEGLQTLIQYQDFKSRVEDSFNMPEALAIVWQTLDSELSDEIKLGLISEFDKILGLKLLEKVEEKEISQDLKDQIQELIKQRVEAKIEKNYALSDQLREKAKELGFELEDTKEGETTYKFVK